MPITDELAGVVHGPRGEFDVAQLKKSQPTGFGRYNGTLATWSAGGTLHAVAPVRVLARRDRGIGWLSGRMGPNHHRQTAKRVTIRVHGSATLSGGEKGKPIVGSPPEVLSTRSAEARSVAGPPSTRSRPVSPAPAGSPPRRMRDGPRRRVGSLGKSSGRQYRFRRSMDPAAARATSRSVVPGRSGQEKTASANRLPVFTRQQHLPRGCDVIPSGSSIVIDEDPQASIRCRRELRRAARATHRAGPDRARFVRRAAVRPRPSRRSNRDRSG